MSLDLSVSLPPIFPMGRPTTSARASGEATNTVRSFKLEQQISARMKRSAISCLARWLGIKTVVRRENGTARPRYIDRDMNIWIEYRHPTERYIEAPVPSR
jgi:hypothetical protein